MVSGMLIYVMHSNRYSSFRLPDVVSGNYMIEDVDSKGIAKNLVNVIASDSNWVIYSNENVRIVATNGQYVEACKLELYSCYVLFTFEREKILLYTMPSYDNHYIIQAAQKDGSLIIGSDSDCNIVYQRNSFFGKQLEVIYHDSKWYVKNLNLQIDLYVNTKKVLNARLNSFDKVFIAGFKFFICGKMIIINDPFKQINIKSDMLTLPSKLLAVEDYKSEFHNYTDYYNDKDYFFKSPIFLKRINRMDIELQSPTEKEEEEYQSLFLTMVPTALMSITTIITTYYSIRNFASGKEDAESFYTTIVMLVVMFILCFIWPFVERFAEKIRFYLRNRNRIKIYQRYLKEKNDTLAKLAEEQKSALFFNNPSLEECQNIINHRSANLFSLNSTQEQFLMIRLGVGRVQLECDLKYNKPDFVKHRDILQDQLDKLVNDYKYIDDAPLTFSLKNSIAFLKEEANFDDYIQSIVLQLVTLHDYHDVKLVIFTSEGSSLSFMRDLNHCWNEERDFRYVATTLQEAETLSAELMRIYTKRKAADSSNYSGPYFVIISDEANRYRNLKLFDEVIHGTQYFGFSLVLFAQRMTDVLDGCSYFCEYSQNKGTLFQTSMESSDIISFSPEVMTDSVDFFDCISKLSNIPIKSNVEGSAGVMLPEKLGFLEMYNVGNVDQLNSLDRWHNSQIVTSLAAPIGVDTTGNVLSLDLHENKHGPHGLVAGMTGSGKSETIITYLLSLAVNYSPSEVQFVLIDYKGGGLAGAFENRRTGIRLPHLIGTITNLDTSEMNRTLVSIKSELKRRQMIFNKAKEELNTGTIDIYKYQGLVRDGRIKEPLSHLFIVCDEFAELKQQQPDFMDEIVSIARIGRSLGIHLILATQKPSGVVDDQVWSNSKFKICCKVQTAEDSSEMLRKPDAAYIKEAGRFYLQIGYDEYYVLAQSGYSGVEYIPSDRATSKLDNSIAFVNVLGETYKNAAFKVEHSVAENKESRGEELINIVKYLINIAKNENYKYQQLWLDNIPERLFYNNVISKYHPKAQKFDINPVIGEYDDPANQLQGIVTLPLTRNGNTFIIGNCGSGKSTLLSMIIGSTIINHNSDEVNIYIIDMGTEKLKKYEKAYQVGEVLTISDASEIQFLIYMLQIEIRKRQDYYSEQGRDFALDVKSGNCPFPNILVFIYDVDVFKETFDYFFDEVISPLTRNCAKYGIYFIVTGSSSSSLGYSVEQNFPQKIMLNMSDPNEYSEYFESYPVIKKNPGRGIISIQEQAFEFQTCLFVEEKQELSFLQSVISQINEHLTSKAKPVPRIPEKVTLDYIKSDDISLSNIPIGVNMVSAQIASYDFDQIVTVISSERARSIVKFSSTLQHLLLSVPKVKLIILNALDGIEITGYESAKVYSSNFVKVMSILKTNILKYNQISSDEKFVVMVLNSTRLQKFLLKQQKEENVEVDGIYDLINLSQENNNFRFILYDVGESYDKLKNESIIDYFDGTEGIWIGNNFESQMMFEVDNASEFGSLSDEYLLRVQHGSAVQVKTVRK